MRLVDRCRFIDSRQLRLTLGRNLNQRAFLRRLEQLADNEYLDRPEQQKRRWWAQGRRLHFVYGLGVEGHKLLYPELHRKGAPATDWRLRNRRVQPLYMDHRLAVTEVMLSFVLGAEQLGMRVESWLEGRDFHRATGLPLHLDLTTSNGVVTVPLNPDAYFVLADDAGRHDHFFLEIDRGTEPIVRTTWQRTAVYRKLAAYWQLYAARIALQRDIPSFRVLTVTTSEARVENMRVLARSMDPKRRGSALFRFATANEINLVAPSLALTAQLWASPASDAALGAIIEPEK